MLHTVRTVIVDEIHAVIGTRRGAHLALSLERLQQIAERPMLRLGLSATQKPIDEVARFLLGTTLSTDRCRIVDEGHRRHMDLGIEIPRSPLDAVMSQEVWEEYYDRLRRSSPPIRRRSSLSTPGAWRSGWRDISATGLEKTRSPPITAASRRRSASMRRRG